MTNSAVLNPACPWHSLLGQEWLCFENLGNKKKKKKNQVWTSVATDKGVAPVRVEGDIEIVIFVVT